ISRFGSMFFKYSIKSSACVPLPQPDRPIKIHTYGFIIVFVVYDTAYVSPIISPLTYPRALWQTFKRLVQSRSGTSALVVQKQEYRARLNAFVRFSPRKAGFIRDRQN